MALDGLPLDLPHPFRDVYVLDETGQINLSLDTSVVGELLNQSRGVAVSRAPRNRRILKTSRGAIRR